MTTYSYTLVLGDSEMITLIEALKLMAERCDRELAAGSEGPFHTWRHNVEQIKARLFENRRQTSGSGFDPESGNRTIRINISGGSPEDSDG